MMQAKEIMNDVIRQTDTGGHCPLKATIEIERNCSLDHTTVEEFVERRQQELGHEH